MSAISLIVFLVATGCGGGRRPSSAPSPIQPTQPASCEGPFEEFYSNADGNPARWTSTDNSPVQVTAPSGQKFLGAENATPEHFGNESVTLTQNDLVAADDKTPCAVQISFRLYIIRSWDGNEVEDEDDPGEFIGPDVFAVNVNGGSPLLTTTFSNYEGGDQNYCPGQPSPCAGKTGKADENTLGYPEIYDSIDTSYDLKFETPYSTDSIVLNFVGSGLEDDRSDESWGLDNIVVAVK